MDKNVREIVDKFANGKAKQAFEKSLSEQLYPDAFQGEYAWLHIKAVLDAHDAYIKRYITEALEELFENN